MHYSCEVLVSVVALYYSRYHVVVVVVGACYVDSCVVVWGMCCGALCCISAQPCKR